MSDSTHDSRVVRRELSLTMARVDSFSRRELPPRFLAISRAREFLCALELRTRNERASEQALRARHPVAMMSAPTIPRAHTRADLSRNLSLKPFLSGPLPR